MQTKNKGNLKSERSKAWIEDALLKIMETEAFYEITIQEIVDHAGLSRRTFYRNYDSKEEIIIERFEKIWKEYEMEVKRQRNFAMPNIARVFFAVMTKHLHFLEIVNRHQLLPVLVARVDELLPSIFYEIKGKQMAYDDETISYALLFGTGGLIRILIKWLGNLKRKSPDEMSQLMERIIHIMNFPTETAILIDGDKG